MNIAEIFYSLQGEGKLVGVPSVFIRTSGCNLRCTWCDTPYASWEPVKNDMTVADILAATARYQAGHVVLTGGEPTIHSGYAELAAAVRARGRHLTVETAGTVFHEVDMDLASISPKLAGSTPWQREGGRFAQVHEAQRINLPALKAYAHSPRISERQWKFVVETPENMQEIEALLKQIDPGIPPSDVLLMPEGITSAVLQERTPWVADLCKQKGYRFCPRLHIALYGNQRGT